MLIKPIPCYGTEALDFGDHYIGLTAFIVLQYICAALFASQLALAVYNSYAFLYRQKKY